MLGRQISVAHIELSGKTRKSRGEYRKHKESNYGN